jgi:acetyltransferase
VHYRYFGALKIDQRIAHDRLARMCFIDYDRETALVAELSQGQEKKIIIGVGRLCKKHGLNEGEFALVIGDRWQGQGLGTALLQNLIEVGRAEKLSRITARILPDNQQMQKISRKLGFRVALDVEDQECHASLDL